MSEMVHYSGTMRLVRKKRNETLEDLCKRIMNLHGYSTLSIYVNSWEEYLRDEMYEKIVVVDGELYEILNREKLGFDDNVFSVSDIGNGKYEFEVMYYNGGCSFNEAIETAMDNVRKRNTSWISCTEKLPDITIDSKYSEDMLTALKWYDGEITYSVGWYNKSGSWNEDCKNCKVIAWQPLPEVYKES